MLKLYNGLTSVCSIKVRIRLAEIGRDDEDVQIDLQKGKQFDPAFMKRNPAATVPVLIDDGPIIVESNLIPEYLDRICSGSPPMRPRPYAGMVPNSGASLGGFGMPSTDPHSPSWTNLRQTKALRTDHIDSANNWKLDQEKTHAVY